MGQLIYMGVRLVAGTLYPAYRSFKAVKTKNVKVSKEHGIAMWVGGHIYHPSMTFKYRIDSNGVLTGVCALDDLLDCFRPLDPGRGGGGPGPRLLVASLLGVQGTLDSDHQNSQCNGLPGRDNI